MTVCWNEKREAWLGGGGGAYHGGGGGAATRRRGTIYGFWAVLSLRVKHRVEPCENAWHGPAGASAESSDPGCRGQETVQVTTSPKGHKYLSLGGCQNYGPFFGSLL